MRTTLDLDVLALDVVRELAAIEKHSLGRITSELILEAVRNRPKPETMLRNGVPLLQRKTGKVVSSEMVEQIMDEEAI